MDLLRDPLWQFIGAILAFLALPTAYWIYLLQRPRKEIAYGVLTTRRLLSLANELRGRVEVIFDGNPVDDVHLLIVGIKNSGNVPILASEFLYPPTIRASNGSTFISAELSKFSPSNLNPSLVLNADRLELMPLLLNPGDHISIQLLTTGQNPSALPDFRIVGTSSIELLVKNRPFSDLESWGAVIRWFLLLGLIMYVGIYMETSIKKIIFVSAPFIIMLAVLYRWARSRIGTEASRYIDDI